MKLYAKISSDRSTKEEGKGGDKWIEIDLYIGADRIGRIVLDYQGSKDYGLSYEKNDGSSSRLIDATEVKKEKGRKMCCACFNEPATRGDYCKQCAQSIPE